MTRLLLGTNLHLKWYQCSADANNTVRIHRAIRGPYFVATLAQRGPSIELVLIAQGSILKHIKK